MTIVLWPPALQRRALPAHLFLRGPNHEATVMRSLQHVLWRGAMALSLLALGIGGSFGFRSAQAEAPACDEVGVLALQAKADEAGRG